MTRDMSIVQFLFGCVGLVCLHAAISSYWRGTSLHGVTADPVFNPQRPNFIGQLCRCGCCSSDPHWYLWVPTAGVLPFLPQTGWENILPEVWYKGRQQPPSPRLRKFFRINEINKWREPPQMESWHLVPPEKSQASLVLASLVPNFRERF